MTVTTQFILSISIILFSGLAAFAKSQTPKCHNLFSSTWHTNFLDIRQLDENLRSTQKKSKVSTSLPLQALRLGPGHIVTYHYSPAQKGKSTFVLLNGLIYDLKNWQDYIQSLTQQGYGVLLVGYSTQPESIARLKKDEKPFYAFNNLTETGPQEGGQFAAGLKLDFLETETLVNEVLSVADEVKLERFHVVSLSYSSEVGRHLAQNFTSRVQSVIFMAPAVRPANRYHLYGESRHQHYAWQKLWNVNPFYDPDYFYDLELLNSMYPLIYSQYSMSKDIGVEFSSFFAGVYQKARSVKWFDLKELADEEIHVPIHLFLAEREDPLLLADQELFWERLQNNPSFRGQKVLFEDLRHALVSDDPELAAEWTIKVSNKK